MLGVMAGAFGAHGLEGRVSEKGLEWWRTGARYQMLHAVVLLVITSSPRHDALDQVWRRRAALLMIFRIVVFSGTLYAMALGGPRKLGMITPVGGASLIAAWAMIAISAWSRARDGHGPKGSM